MTYTLALLILAVIAGTSAACCLGVWLARPVRKWISACLDHVAVEMR